MMLRRTSIFLHISIIGAVFSAVAFGIIPLCNIFGNLTERIFAIFFALVFWLGIIIEHVFFWIANRCRKIVNEQAFGGKNLVRPTIGLITFFSNREAKTFDVVLFTSTILILLLLLVKVKHGWGQHLCVTAMLLSLNLHCIFNGRTYRYIKEFNDIKKRSQRT